MHGFSIAFIAFQHPEREAPFSSSAEQLLLFLPQSTAADHHWPPLCQFRIDVRPLPAATSPDDKRTALPVSRSQPPLHIWYPSSAKCYCNTCSSRHIPLTLTLQPLAKLGPAIRRDQDSTVSGPLSCASSFPPAWSSLLSSAYLHLPCGLEAYQ
jgi:hypothetical protein